jgi:PAS domain S-box-containing protein
MNGILQTTLAALSGACFYGAVHYAWLGWRKPRNIPYLTFALLNASVGLYVLCKLGSYHAESAELLVARRRDEVSAAILFFAVLPWFVTTYCNSSNYIAASIINFVWMLAFISNATAPFGLSYHSLPEFRYITLPWGEQLADLRPHRTLMFTSIFIIMFMNFGWYLYLCLHQRRKENTHIGGLIIALTILLSGLIFNFMVNARQIQSPQIAEFGFIAMILFMNWRLNSEVRDTRDAMMLSEARFRVLVEQAKDAIFLLDTDGQVLDVNKQACESLGYTRNELTSMNVSDIETGVTGENMQTLWRNMRESPQTIEGKHRRKNGSEFPVEVRVGLFQGKAHDLALAIARDISQRKHTEAELNNYRDHLEEMVKQRTRELEQANKEIESFSYSVSHDLRAPLRSIDGFAHALQEELGDNINDAGRDYIKRIRNSIDRMRNLIDGLLQLSRCSRESLTPTTLNLSAMAHEIVLQLRANEPQRQTHINISPGLVATADARLMQIALTNMLSNAWKYTGMKNETRIEVGQQRLDDKTIFFIRDNGAGFDMRYADKLFTAFQRLHGSEFPGSGIGLTTVQRIIHRHGGRIWAESDLNKGACFYFTLGTAERY